jgi:hypothetical protein
MDIAGKPVLFHLTTSGQRSIGRLLAGKSSFQSFVVGTDGVGAWVLFPGTKGAISGDSLPVMLLKWEYISAVVFEFRPEPVPSRRGIGFVPRRGAD